MQTAEIPQVLARLRHRALTVTLTPSWTPAWLDTYCAIEHVSAHRRPIYDAMWGRVRAAKAFGLVVLDGQPAAVGLCVADGELGRALQHRHPPGLSTAGRGLGVDPRAGRLGVRAGREPTSICRCGRKTNRLWRLYERLGFSTLYQYHIGSWRGIGREKPTQVE